ncbi:MAG TPA: hypothetical protein VFI11_10430 [Anaerolineales bacterium]|nr:hypothetical protein [Anaerolineales bacterium]
MPGPAWLTYLVMAAAGSALFILAARTGGDYRPGEFLAFHVWIAAQAVYMLGLMHYLDRSAGSAVVNFRSMIDGHRPSARSGVDDSTTFADLRYRLTTLPPRPTWLAALAGAAFGFALPFLFLGSDVADPRSAAVLARFGFSSPSVFFLRFFQAYFILIEAVSGTLVFHTVHQLRQISQVYASQTRLNLYRLQPLYAFSVPAGLTSAGLILYTYAWFGTAPMLLAEPISRMIGFFFVAVAAMTFAWPLLGIHRRLVDEKKRLLAKSAEKFEATVAELHRRVDENALKAMDDLNKTLSSLEIEQTALRRIPTWPWEPGTLRGVIAALILPIAIWLIQLLLGRWLAA